MADNEPRQADARINLADEPQFSIGGLGIFPSELAVEIHGQRRELQPRVMRVLIALAKARPKVVPRDRLIAECWDGRIVGDDAINRCILALRHLAEEFEPAPFAIETVPRVGHRLVQHAENSASSIPLQRSTRAWIAGASAAIIVPVVAVFLLGSPERWSWNSGARVPRVLIEPGSGDSASVALAQELATRLGSLVQARSPATRLINGSRASDQKADLILQVRRSDNGGLPIANVILMDPSGGILWTKEFNAFTPNNSDFSQQIAFSAGRVLGCAAEAVGNMKRPTDQDLKPYLNACAALTDSGADAEKIVPILRGIVSRAPKFSGGWTRLLRAETEVADETDDPEGDAIRRALPNDIAAARRHFPDLPEAYIAEYKLKAPADLLGRSRILDIAVERNPDDSEARAERAIFLESVGRVSDAVREAHEAATLDPLSLTAQDTYILALALANRTDAAWAELAKAERQWPGATNVLMMRYWLNLRFGDPREALRLLRSGAVDTPGAQIQEAFLEARISPSQENIELAVRLGRNAVRLYPGAIDGQLQTLAQFGRREELFVILLNWRRMDLADLLTGVIFRPAFSDLRRDGRFMQVANHLGLLTYWRRTGKWPDFCLAPDLPYDCKAISSNSS